MLAPSERLILTHAVDRDACANAFQEQRYMLRDIHISSKLMIVILISVLGTLAIAALGMVTLRQNLVEDRKAKLRDLVQIAVQMLDHDRESAISAGLSEAETIARSKALLSSLRFGRSDYFYALEMDGTIAAHANPKLIGKSLIDKPDPDGVFPARRELELVKQGLSGFVQFRFPRAAGGEAVPKISYATPYKPYNWDVAGGIYLDDVDSIFRSELLRIGALGGLALALVVGISAILVRSIVNPITGMTFAMQRLASGQVQTSIPALERGDEVGKMARSVQVFKQSMVETERLRREQDEAKLQSETEKKALVGKLADDFERGVSATLEQLAVSASRLRSMSGAMSSTATDASGQAHTVATAAEQATANVRTVAVATEQLSSSITEIGGQVAHSTEIAGKAVKEAIRTNVTVRGLSEAAAKIGDIVQLISGIASQTNLLALNATIEAARAGEAGKGFAVVASEVKSLASQTAKATEEISNQVSTMQTATSEAVQAIQRIGDTISSINEIATVIAAAVEEQRAATKDIALSVNQAAQGTDQVLQNIVGVNHAVGKTGSAAEQVLIASDELNNQSSKLRQDIDYFLLSVRAA